VKQPTTSHPAPVHMAETAADIAAVGLLFREMNSLQHDLCFQGFDEELATLPGDYAAPRGALLLAGVGPDLAGCCGLRPLDASDDPNACEMKRLYVRSGFRGSGIGRTLAEACLDRPRQAGYGSLLLDTLDCTWRAPGRSNWKSSPWALRTIPPYYQ